MIRKLIYFEGDGQCGLGFDKPWVELAAGHRCSAAMRGVTRLRHMTAWWVFVSLPWPGVAKPGSRSDAIIQSGDFQPTHVKAFTIETAQACSDS